MYGVKELTAQDQQLSFMPHKREEARVAKLTGVGGLVEGAPGVQRAASSAAASPSDALGGTGLHAPPTPADMASEATERGKPSLRALVTSELVLAREAWRKLDTAEHRQHFVSLARYFGMNYDTDLDRLLYGLSTRTVLRSIPFMTDVLFEQLTAYLDEHLGVPTHLDGSPHKRELKTFYELHADGSYTAVQHWVFTKPGNVLACAEMDAWATPQVNKELLGLSLRIVDKNYETQRLLLGLIPFYHPRNAEAIIAHVDLMLARVGRTTSSLLLMTVDQGANGLRAIRMSTYVLLICSAHLANLALQDAISDVHPSVDGEAGIAPGMVLLQPVLEMAARFSAQNSVSRQALQVSAARGGKSSVVFSTLSGTRAWSSLTTILSQYLALHDILHALTPKELGYTSPADQASWYVLLGNLNNVDAELRDLSQLFNIVLCTMESFQWADTLVSSVRGKWVAMIADVAALRGKMSGEAALVCESVVNNLTVRFHSLAPPGSVSLLMLKLAELLDVETGAVYAMNVAFAEGSLIDATDAQKESSRLANEEYKLLRDLAVEITSRTWPKKAAGTPASGTWDAVPSAVAAEMNAWSRTQGIVAPKVVHHPPRVGRTRSLVLSGRALRYRGAWKRYESTDKQLTPIGCLAKGFGAASISESA